MELVLKLKEDLEQEYFHVKEIGKILLEAGQRDRKPFVFPVICNDDTEDGRERNEEYRIHPG